MDPGRWQRLDDLFHEALALDPTARAEYLRIHARDDESLLFEVQGMLEAHEQGRAPAIESELIHDSDPSVPLGALEPTPGTRIGPYRVRELIGRGGMGLVYSADRADGQFAQTVAIKLIRAGLLTADLVERFLAERQILARLEHAGIARLLDGGITDSGIPWLAMELVHGRSVTAHCDAERLTIDQRLELFFQVCRPVQHAHANLIVHRDLKPSNILVTADGSIKLLDFGIARLLTPDAEPVDATRTLLHAMTPEYASPEQIQGGAVTTATDVYALGLLLYELLCGERAQPAGASLAALHRAICEEDPLPPSRRLAALSAELAAQRAQERGLVRPARLRRKLSGDLDRIVCAALHKDPARRYTSVESLARDIERYRVGLPVLAQRETLTYRARKFARRHAVGLTATAVVIVAITTGLVLAITGMVRAREAEQRARAEATTASSVATFLVDLFRANDPAESRGDALTARELLDRGAVRVRDQLEDEPLVRARLLRAIGLAYESLGLYTDAQPLLADAAALLDSAGPDTRRDRAVVVGELSTVLMRSGDYERARELAGEAVAVFEASGDTASPELMRTLNRLGMANARLGDLPSARSALDRALALGERLFGPDNSSYSGTINNLATVNWLLGDTDRARSLYERALRIVERDFGSDHPMVAHTLNNLALAYRQAGDLHAAAAAHERALAIRTAILEPDHPDIAESLNNLGVVYLALEQYDRAYDVLTRARAIRERALGAGHALTMSTIANLATALYHTGELDSAEALYRTARAGLSRELGDDHIEVAFPTLGLARIASARGDTAAADSAFRAAIEIHERRGSAAHPDYQVALAEYAAFLERAGRNAEADSIRRRLDAIRAAAESTG